jgi:hypothetical protein
LKHTLIGVETLSDRSLDLVAVEVFMIVEAFETVHRLRDKFLFIRNDIGALSCCQGQQ